MEPRLISEISSRLLALDPCVREFFGLETVKMSGKDLEELACAIWMVGYGAALGDVMDLPGPLPDLTAIAEQWGWEDDGSVGDDSDNADDDWRI